MNKIKRIEKYLYDFFSNRYENIDLIYKEAHRERRTGIYMLKEGSRLLDLFNDIHGNIQEQFYFKNLVPHKFATPESLIDALDRFKNHLEENQYYIDINYDAENTSYIVYDIQRIKNELVQAIDYVKRIYDYEDTVVPYQELRYNLIVNNIPNFISVLKSVLASVSYAIAKTQEGFFHSNVHLILKLLGFEILSEELTNIGRIDAVIRFSDKLYILEFKFNKEEDLSGEALEQIKENEYAQKFTIERKDIYGIGISFSRDTRNINGFKLEKLN